MLENHVATVNELDAIIANPPTSEGRQMLRQHAEGTFGPYIFDHLRRPDWLPVLLEDGLFEQDQVNQFPYRLQYLQVVAKAEPWAVTYTLRHYHQLDDRALYVASQILPVLPEADRRLLLPTVERWLSQRRLLFFATAKQLLQAYLPMNDASAAFMLELLLTPWREPSRSSELDQERISTLGALTHLEAHEYQMLLEVASRSPHSTQWLLPALCRVLGRFASIINTTAEWELSHFDFHLNSSFQFGLDGPEIIVCQHILKLVGEKQRSPQAFKFAWNTLDQPYGVFRILKLKLLSELSEVPRSWVTALLLDRELFEFSDHYPAALQRHFQHLSRPNQRLILDWVAEGSSSRREVKPGSQASEYWTWRQLHAFGDVLPDELRPARLALDEQFGQKAPPMRAMYSRMGYSSSLKAEHLSSLSLEEVAALLREPPPPTGDPHFDALSDRLGGLHDLIRGDVQRRPVAYLNQLESFLEVPGFVSTIAAALSMTSASLEGVVFSRFVDLFDRVNTLAEEAAAQSESAGTWSAARGSLCDLLEGKLLADENLSRQWGAGPGLLANVARALRDPDPRPAPERDDAASRPLDLSLNVTRGKAIHALLRLMSWFHDHRDNPQMAQNYEQAKEVMLTHYRDREHSGAVFAATAAKLPWLQYTDSPFFDNLKPLFFNRETPAISGAVWVTHLTFNKFFNKLFGALREEYRLYVLEDLRGPDAVWPVTDSNQKDFAEHLAIFTIRGELPADDPMLEAFFRRADPKAAKYAVEYLGWVLSNEKEVLPEEIIQRLQAFWTQVSRVWSVDHANRPVLLAAFGRWFSNKYLPLKWRFAELNTVLDQQPTSLVDRYDLMGTLTELAPKYPLEVLGILNKLAASEGQPYRLLDYLAVLDSLKEQTNPEVTLAVNRLVNTAIGRGIVDEFRPYYREPGSNPS